MKIKRLGKGIVIKYILDNIDNLLNESPDYQIAFINEVIKHTEEDPHKLFISPVYFRRIKDYQPELDKEYELEFYDYPETVGFYSRLWTPWNKIGSTPQLQFIYMVRKVYLNIDIHDKDNENFSWGLFFRTLTYWLNQLELDNFEIFDHWFKIICKEVNLPYDFFNFEANISDLVKKKYESIKKEENTLAGD
jgi:hypothetical protein